MANIVRTMGDLQAKGFAVCIGFLLKKMKYFLAAFALLLTAPLLTGCNYLIEDSVLHVTPHVAEVTPHPDLGDYIVIESAAELARVILHMVEQRAAGGLLRLVDLDAAGAEDMLSDVILDLGQRPFVAYAVNVFTPRILAEATAGVELELMISYQKTPAQMAAVQTVPVARNAVLALREILHDGTGYTAFLSPANVANVSFLEGVILDHYFNQALNVIRLPAVQISLYPSSGAGTHRIAELEFDFGYTPDELAQMQADLVSAAADLLESLPDDLPQTDLLVRLAASLAEIIALDESPPPAMNFIAPRALSHTAYGALVLGEASSEGFAFALRAALDLLDIPSRIIQGERDGRRHVWNLIELDGNFYHMDSTAIPVAAFVSDEIMFQNGYSWDLSLYPRADHARAH